MGGNLDRDELIETARAETGLDDFGDVPFIGPLDVLIESLNREAGLEGDRERAAAATLVGLLTKRLQLVRDRTRFPAIADEEVVAPVFILGLPRTGSTHLHALMGQAEGIRTPRYWEMTRPSPPPERETYESDPRIAQVHSGRRAPSPELPGWDRAMAAGGRAGPEVGRNAGRILIGPGKGANADIVPG
ncbi:MAG: sulfotransferase [Acidimicrobiia bacterium]